MIRHLNPEGFRLFGTILPDGGSLSKKPNHHSIFLKASTVSSYRAVAPLWLGAESGLTILSVSADGGNFTDFYLDRAVRLKSGIWFRLAGFRGSGSVQMSGSSMPLSLGLRADTRDFAVRPKVRVACLYTLFYQEKEKGFFFKGEQHSAVELTYIDKGSMHSVVSGTDIILRQGELMLYGENQWHMQYADIDTAVSFITISMDLDCSYADLLYNRKFTASQRTAQLLQQILEEYERDDVFSSDLIICKVQEVLLTTLRDDQTTGKPEALKTPAAMNNENEIIARALDYIGTHVYEKLSVSTVAGEANVSASYLTALFHKYMQLSPGEYIRRTKLEESKKLIREGKMNFTQIAQQLQYSTVHHFSRQFKEKFGITPTEYARAIR